MGGKEPPPIKTMTDSLSYGPFISRSQAKEQNLKHYYTGKLCKNGHIDLRSVGDGSCMACQRMYKRSERTHAQVNARYAARKNDPEFKERQHHYQRTSYARRRQDPTKVEIDRARSRAYGMTPAGQISRKECMARFVAKGAKAESDEQYRQTAKGQSVMRASRKKHIKKVEAREGVSYTKFLRDTNPNYKLHVNLNTRIRMALKNCGSTKETSTTRLIGCSIQFARLYLEYQFLPGMSWENYGEWHIDHIRPCASFPDLATSLEQQKECFHHTNLQPLWAADNLAKSDKWEAA